MDLASWEFLFTYGYDLDLYSKGNKRMAICRATGRVVVKYTVQKGVGQ